MQAFILSIAFTSCLPSLLACRDVGWCAHLASQGVVHALVPVISGALTWLEQLVALRILSKLTRASASIAALVLSQFPEAAVVSCATVAVHSLNHIVNACIVKPGRMTTLFPRLLTTPFLDAGRDGYLNILAQPGGHATRQHSRSSSVTQAYLVKLCTRPRAYALRVLTNLVTQGTEEAASVSQVCLAELWSWICAWLMVFPMHTQDTVLEAITQLLFCDERATTVDALSLLLAITSRAECLASVLESGILRFLGPLLALRGSSDADAVAEASLAYGILMKLAQFPAGCTAMLGCGLLRSVVPWLADCSALGSVHH